MRCKAPKWHCSYLKTIVFKRHSRNIICLQRVEGCIRVPISGFEPSFFILFIYFRLIDFLIFQKKEGLKAFTEVSFFLYSVGGGWTFPALINCFPCSFGLFFSRNVRQNGRILPSCNNRQIPGDGCRHSFEKLYTLSTIYPIMTL